MDIENLLKSSYWFSTPLEAEGWVMYTIVGVLLAMVLVGLLAKIARLSKKETWQKEFLRRVGNFGLTMGLLGLVWLFFRQEKIMFFSQRFWMLFWFLGVICWKYRLLRYLIVRVPVIKQEAYHRELQNKYKV